MCLIFHKPADVTFNEELLRDFYSRNRDGFGIMYAEGGKLHFHKQIGKVEDWLAFFEKHKHREAVFHLRMQTHGHIDLENTHPYPVFGFDEPSSHPLLLMHNGILMEGNASDLSKSDTWHYIRKHLRPMLQGNVDYAFTLSFNTLVGRHIGSSNRFVLMDGAGRVQIVNKDTGVMYERAWFSNEYAWSASKYLKGRSKYYPAMGDVSGVRRWDDSRYDRYWDKQAKATWERDEPRWREETRPDGSKYWTDGTSQHDAASGATKLLPAPKSKRQLKREAKAARLAQAKAKRTGSQVIDLKAPTTASTTTTTDEVGESFRAKRELIRAERLDDVMELRSMLDIAYPDAPTKDSELQELLDAIGPTKAYFLMELLMEGRIKKSLWDFTLRAPSHMRTFAGMPMSSWEKVPKGKFSNERAFTSTPATEEEGAVQDV